MKRTVRVIAILAAALMALAIAAPAQAGGPTPKPTELDFDDLSQDGDIARGIGSIDTVKKCRQGREVTLEGDQVIGTDSTSANGAWVISGQGNINDFVKITVKGKTVGKGNNRVRCGKDEIILL